MDLLRLDWKTVIEYCERLAGMAAPYGPDIIVGLSRGGLVPARILSDIMGVKELGVLGISFYKGMGVTGGFPRITQELGMEVKGKKALIVDDVADTGRSLEVARDYLARMGAKEIRIATIHYKPTSAFRPDYYVMTATTWIAYPWKRHEIERELAGKAGK